MSKEELVSLCDFLSRLIIFLPCLEDGVVIWEIRMACHFPVYNARECGRCFSNLFKCLLINTSSRCPGEEVGGAYSRESTDLADRSTHGHEELPSLKDIGHLAPRT